MTPRQYLVDLGRPFVTLPDIAKALGLDYHTLYFRLRDLPDTEKPEAHGAFRAGAATTWTLAAGSDFAEHHARFWKERQAAKQAAKEAAR